MTIPSYNDHAMRYAVGISIGAIAGAMTAEFVGFVVGGVTGGLAFEGQEPTFLEGAQFGVTAFAAVFAPSAAVIGGIAGGLWVRHGRNRRASRGCCRMCGYDLRGNLEGGCCECGWNRETTRA